VGEPLVSKTQATPHKEELPEQAETSPDQPLLDFSDAAVEKFIRAAEKLGYVTHDQINSTLRSGAVNSEQMEDLLAMLGETGIHVVEAEPDEDDRRDEFEEGGNGGGEIVEVQRTAPANVKKTEPPGRTDDPVGMYLQAMRSIELLSRDGEIAIAKRIEAGREAMIAGLCESPLSFQAIIIWRDELNEGKVFLRDIIDLEATYAGPDAKPAPVIGPDGQPLPPGQAPAPATPGGPTLASAAAPPAAPAAATPFKAAAPAQDRSNERANGGNGGEEGEEGPGLPQVCVPDRFETASHQHHPAGLQRDA
jgi:RNA polymerase primary sigma factor